MSRFFGKERRISRFIEDEDEILQQILAQPAAVKLKKLPEGSRLRSAGTDDIPVLVELFKAVMAAEMTDCATLLDYRGQGLMSILINALEDEMRKEQMQTLYSLSRALSHGINLVFHRHGYTYGGRLINNCNIMGKFEDMNLWVKELEPDIPRDININSGIF